MFRTCTTSSQRACLPSLHRTLRYNKRELLSVHSKTRSRESLPLSTKRSSLWSPISHRHQTIWLWTGLAECRGSRTRDHMVSWPARSRSTKVVPDAIECGSEAPFLEVGKLTVKLPERKFLSQLRQQMCHGMLELTFQIDGRHGLIGKTPLNSLINTIL